MIHILTFHSIDEFDRIVFKDQYDNYFKTVLLYSDNFNELPYEAQIDFINQSILCIIPNPDEEPLFPVKKFKYIYIMKKDLIVNTIN